MGSAKVSIVVPVYNSAPYLREALDCLVAQTMPDFEAICVDDASTDDSAAILREYAACDARFRVVSQDHKGAGAARNCGIDQAQGEYLYFFDSDDLCDPHLLELAVARAEETEADIVAFGFTRFFPDGRTNNGVGVHTEWLPKDIEVFNYQDCLDRIMNVVNPTPWNKLYRTDFVKGNGLRFEEITSTNDVTFAAVSVTTAQQVAILHKQLFSYRIGTEGTITASKEQSLDNVTVAIDSAFRQVMALPYHEEIDEAITFFIAEIYLSALYRYVKDPSLPSVQRFYEGMRRMFLSERFDMPVATLQAKEKLLNRVRIVQARSYEEFRDLFAKRIVVSLTSYPKRIGCVSSVLESIYAQTRQPGEVVLWLGDDRFPGKECDLPDDLQKLIADGMLTVRWRVDLRPHTKYFYAFKEYSDDVIVTVDDDIVYSPNMLDDLFDSYLLHPDAVSAARVHLVAIAEDGDVLPYERWMTETDACIYEPSMQLFATGVGGVLYPPHLLDERMLDEDAIRENCLFADDIWLKAMEVVSGVPVALARHYSALKYVPGSQDDALWRMNRGDDAGAGGNDVQMRNVVAWVDEVYGAGTFKAGLTSSDIGMSQMGFAVYADHVAARLRREADSAARQRGRLNGQIKKLEAANRKLEGQKRDLSAKNAKLSKRVVGLEKEIDRIHASTTWKAGRVVTWPARKLKKLVRSFFKKR